MKSHGFYWVFSHRFSNQSLYFIRTFAGKESTFYELDDVRHVAKKDSDKNISMSEKMTQTDWQMFDRTFSGDLAAATQGIYYYH